MVLHEQATASTVKSTHCNCYYPAIIILAYASLLAVKAIGVYNPGPS